MFIRKNVGFTLIEVIVSITIIGLLVSVVYASFSDARTQARDQARWAALKETQLAIEFYKAQNGRYPAAGCGAAFTDFAGPGPATVSGYTSCTEYISGLVPEYIAALPTDPLFENDADTGYYYRTDANGTSFKLLAKDSIELFFATGPGDEIARCPMLTGACASGVPAATYAVYGGSASVGW